MTYHGFALRLGKDLLSISSALAKQLWQAHGKPTAIQKTWSAARGGGVDARTVKIGVWDVEEWEVVGDNVKFELLGTVRLFHKPEGLVSSKSR